MSTNPTFKPSVQNFFHEASNTCTFVLYDAATKDAVIIDPVTDLDAVNWQIGHSFNDSILAWVKEQGLKVHLAMDTHVHADHISGLSYIKAKLGVPIAIGAKITTVQKTFSGLYNMPSFPCDGTQFDRLLHDNEVVEAGSLSITCWATPGHTPNCMSYLCGDAVFTGDLMFTEDFGCGRCDFPGGCAGDMYDSVMRLYNGLPAETRVFVGHDYQPGGRPLRYESTIGLEAEKQEDLPKSGKREDFVAGKTGYDKTLSLPRLIFPSLITNIDAGRLPAEESNGHRYFKIPMNTKVGKTDALGVPAAAAAEDKKE
jgi:glyoxylase-like metal-dependent hydrolase (beta-lactamase superfamily II)